MLHAGGGCEIAATTPVKTAWKKFRKLLPVLTSHHLSYKTRGRVYSSCVWSTMLHASEIWQLTKKNLQCLQRNDRAMIRQICSIKPEDVARVRSSEFLAKLEDLNLILRERRLRWFGHVECSSGAIRTACDIQIDGRRGAGRPKLTWKKLTQRDCREWKLTTVDPQERSTWRSSWDLLCVQLASYLERGPLMWTMPLHLHVNQKADYDIIWWAAMNDPTHILPAVVCGRVKKQSVNTKEVGCGNLDHPGSSGVWSAWPDLSFYCQDVHTTQCKINIVSITKNVEIVERIITMCYFCWIEMASSKNWTIIETSCKNVSSILTKSFICIGKQRDLTPSGIEEELFIAKNLKNSDRNPQNQLWFHDAEMHVTYRILEHYHAFHFFQPLASSIECFVS